MPSESFVPTALLSQKYELELSQRVAKLLACHYSKEKSVVCRNKFECKERKGGRKTEIKQWSLYWEMNKVVLSPSWPCISYASVV